MIKRLLILALILFFIYETKLVEALNHGVTKPDPLTAKEAIAMVRADEIFSKIVEPYKKELDWKAEYVKNCQYVTEFSLWETKHTSSCWYVIGLFESPWGAKFVRHATILKGKVYVSGYQYIGFDSPSKFDPPYYWIISKVKEWGLKTLYTRLTPEVAINLVTEEIEYKLKNSKILDVVAELVKENPKTQLWYFVFYIQKKDNLKYVVFVEAEEGWNFRNKKYNFEWADFYWETPLYAVDWVRKIAKERGWKEISNLR